MTSAAGQVAAQAYPNPRTVTVEGVGEVLRAAYEGRPPTHIPA